MNVSFPDSSITSIIGPNGCGKSTLLKSMVGLCCQKEGTILLNGKELLPTHKTVAKQIAYFAQNHNAPSLTVEQLILHGRFPYLTYPRRYTTDDISICDHVIDELNLNTLRNTCANELSGGELQRVFFAMTLVSQAEVFLFDEPNSFLDIKYQLEMLQNMKKLRNDNKTIVAVLHDINYAMQISDQIIVMDHGQIIDYGTPIEIYNRGSVEKVFHVKCELLTGNDGKSHYIIY
ncbi:MAG: ABC transporter ATP-binding protein [Lachnospiraceae bacterium]|nr:ABC transporter ATP-binding protein [Lachnospiraceae bacterium]